MTFTPRATKGPKLTVKIFMQILTLKVATLGCQHPPIVATQLYHNQMIASTPTRMSTQA